MATYSAVISPSLTGRDGVGLFSCARLHPKGGGDCREDSDYDVEDFAPSGVVVECSHRLVRGPTLTLPVWRGRGSRDACATRGDKVGFC